MLFAGYCIYPTTVSVILQNYCWEDRRILYLSNNSFSHITELLLGRQHH